MDAQVSPETNYSMTRRIKAAGVSGFIASTLMAVLGRYGYTIPAELQPYLVTAITLVITIIVQPSKQDILARLNDAIVKEAQNDPNIPVSKPAATTAPPVKK